MNNIITIDAETYFDDEFSLKKMTTENYIRDPRFEVHGWAVKFNEGPAIWVGAMAFHGIEWQERLSKSPVLAHHAQFDLFILNHHYQIRPLIILDTLSMARLMLGNHVSASLDSVAKHFGLAAKTVPYDLFKGKHWHELDAATQKLVADGACHDVELTWQIFNRLMAGD